jgi:hypothetical protein
MKRTRAMRQSICTALILGCLVAGFPGFVSGSSVVTESIGRVARLAMKAKASPDFTGYWQRHIAN